jgi:hypothetical protein
VVKTMEPQAQETLRPTVAKKIADL